MGPGCSNLLTAAAVASVNRIPLLMLSGDYFAHRAVDPVLQQVETFTDPTVSVCDAFKPVVRYWDRISRPEQIIRSLPQALATMLDPADCGPAFFALPQDVQAEAFDYPMAFFTERYHYIRRPVPDRRDVDAAADILAKARRPLVIAGGGVRYSEANEQIARLVERRAIPLAETAAGKATVRGDHPHNVGTLGIIGSSSANAVAADADVIVAIGTRLQDFTTGSWSVFKNPDARFILINTNRWDAAKRSDCAVIGDARESLDALDQALGDYRAPTSWFEDARRHVQSWNDYLDGWRGRTDLDPPSYGQVIRACNALATPADYVVCAAGGIVGELTMAWSALAENTFDCEWGFSTMGYEVSGAVGREHGTERRTNGVDRRGARVHGGRFLSDGQLRRLLHGADRPQGDLHRVRQRRVRRDQSAAGRPGRCRVQQSLRVDPSDRRLPRRPREAPRSDGRASPRA